MPPRTFQVTIDKDRLFNAQIELFLAYGRIMTAWAQLESALYYWFFAITKMSDPMARAIYYGARGFAARLEMLEAAMEHTTTLASTEITFLKEALKKARSYSRFRNKIAHGEPRLNLARPPGEDFAAHFTITQGKDMPVGGQQALTLSKLGIATENFQTLALCVGDMSPTFKRKNPLSPEECLSRVLALPNEPHVESDQTPTGSAQQPQEPLHRNKKAYRAEQAAKKDSLPEGG